MAEVQACGPSPTVDLAALVAAGTAMREAQRAYFRLRSRDALIASKEAERRFDQALGAASLVLAVRRLEAPGGER